MKRDDYEGKAKGIMRNVIPKKNKKFAYSKFAFSPTFQNHPANVANYLTLSLIFSNLDRFTEIYITG